MEFERVVPFSTVHNFRDLGGYRSRYGEAVRCGRLYRADGLFSLTGSDHERFAALGIRTVLDLRRPDELVSEGRIAERLGDCAFAYHHVDLCAAIWPEDRSLTIDGMARYLATRYGEMADAGVVGDNPVGRALTMVADAGRAPLVFHCSAGKDRTGVLAALTLALLGVDDADIADDYALSALARRRFEVWIRRAAERGLPAPAWAFNPSPRQAMVLFLDELRQRYGSVEAYVAKAGVGAPEIAALRTHLLAP